MKTPPRKDDDGSGKRRTGAPESKPSNETFPRRTDPPGQVGLANETRPGLGSRRENPFPGEPGGGGGARLPLPGDELPEDDEMTDNVAGRQRSGREPNDQPLPKEPQEQRSDSLEREQERSTGASGQL